MLPDVNLKAASIAQAKEIPITTQAKVPACFLRYRVPKNKTMIELTNGKSVAQTRSLRTVS